MQAIKIKHLNKFLLPKILQNKTPLGEITHLGGDNISTKGDNNLTKLTIQHRSFLIPLQMYIFNINKGTYK